MLGNLKQYTIRYVHNSEGLNGPTVLKMQVAETAMDAEMGFGHARLFCTANQPGLTFKLHVSNIHTGVTILWLCAPVNRLAEIGLPGN